MADAPNNHNLIVELCPLLEDVVAMIEATSRGYSLAMDDLEATLLMLTPEMRAAVLGRNELELVAMAKLRDECGVMRSVAIRVMSLYSGASAASLKVSPPTLPFTPSTTELAEAINRVATVLDCAITGPMLNAHSMTCEADAVKFCIDSQAKAGEFRQLKSAAEMLAAVLARVLSLYEDRRSYES